MKILWTGLMAWALCGATAGAAEWDAAVAFGARENVRNLHLSPDGRSVAYLAPSGTQGDTLYTLSLESGAKAVPALLADGKGERLSHCEWVANDRLACTLVGYLRTVEYLSYFTREVAVDADGKNLRLLSDRVNDHSYGNLAYGGSILERIPESGSVLMERLTVPDDHLGTRIATTSAQSGLRVDRVNTRTGDAVTVEVPNPLAEAYFPDGSGTVRVMAVRGPRQAGYDSPETDYLFRRGARGKWESLSQWNPLTRTGFEPLAVVGERVYGLAPRNGYLAAVSMPLNGTGESEVLFAGDGVDVAGFARFGYHQRVVGVRYADDYVRTEYTDADLKALMAKLAKAIAGGHAVQPVDASLDERKLLLYAGSDQDPGVYYLFDRDARKLETFLVARTPLEGVALSPMRPIQFPAHDGTQIPGYLTLPPGHEDAKGLPAIVMPHGGPAARDVWGFDWLAQFYAHQGYAVLQPNFRGSSGYGDGWFQKNGFQSWQVAIGDIIDGAKWLAASGVADPSRIAVVGWSYGGYAALQSAVVDSGVFKAIVAIAPVTDLDLLKEESRPYSNFHIVSDYVGSGPHVREGSPALNAGKIHVPVLLFHGDEDRNVDIEQSRKMDRALTAAAVPHELVVYPGLDHALDDSTARTDLLRRSDAFLRKILMP